MEKKETMAALPAETGATVEPDLGWIFPQYSS